VIPNGFGYLKNSESRNHQFRVFQELQRTTGFHERTGKDRMVLGRYFSYLFILKTWLYVVTGHLKFFLNYGYLSTPSI
jgi:hypothetical protein